MMNKSKKARPDAGTSGQAVREDALQGNASHIQFNTATVGGQGSIASLLMTGCENGLHLSELVQLTGEDERSIRRRIQAERKAGKLILADNKSGYFLPASEYEVRRFIRSMSRRSREIAAISHAAEDALLKMTGQETLRGWQDG